MLLRAACFVLPAACLRTLRNKFRDGARCSFLDSLLHSCPSFVSSSSSSASSSASSFRAVHSPIVTARCCLPPFECVRADGRADNNLFVFLCVVFFVDFLPSFLPSFRAHARTRVSLHARAGRLEPAFDELHLRQLPGGVQDPHGQARGWGRWAWLSPTALNE